MLSVLVFGGPASLSALAAAEQVRPAAEQALLARAAAMISEMARR